MWALSAGPLPARSAASVHRGSPRAARTVRRASPASTDSTPAVPYELESFNSAAATAERRLEEVRRVLAESRKATVSGDLSSAEAALAEVEKNLAAVRAGYSQRALGAGAVSSAQRGAAAVVTAKALPSLPPLPSSAEVAARLESAAAACTVALRALATRSLVAQAAAATVLSALLSTALSHFSTGKAKFTTLFWKCLALATAASLSSSASAKVALRQASLLASTSLAAAGPAASLLATRAAAFATSSRLLLGRHLTAAAAASAAATASAATFVRSQPGGAPALDAVAAAPELFAGLAVASLLLSARMSGRIVDPPPPPPVAATSRAARSKPAQRKQQPAVTAWTKAAAKPAKAAAAPAAPQHKESHTLLLNWDGKVVGSTLLKRLAAANAAAPGAPPYVLLDGALLSKLEGAQSQQRWMLASGLVAGTALGVALASHVK